MAGPGHSKEPLISSPMPTEPVTLEAYSTSRHSSNLKLSKHWMWSLPLPPLIIRFCNVCMIDNLLLLGILVLLAPEFGTFLPVRPQAPRLPASAYRHFYSKVSHSAWSCATYRAPELWFSQTPCPAGPLLALPGSGSDILHPKRKAEGFTLMSNQQSAGRVDSHHRPISLPLFKEKFPK